MNYIDEYRKMFNNITITKQPNYEYIRLLRDRDIYTKVENITKIPWWVVGILNVMENGGDMSKHLANGDDLKYPTKNVPAGIPPGPGPFTWEESAIYILNKKKENIFNNVDWEDIGAILDAMEKWNGTGYRNKGIWSPYLFCGTNFYTKGKYTSDNKFNKDAISLQTGVATMIKKLIEMNKIPDFNNIPIPSSTTVVTNPDPVVDNTVKLADSLITSIIKFFQKNKK